MEANEIMVNEDVMEMTEEVTTSTPNKGLKIAAGIGLAALVGAVAYKFVAKPIAAKIKAKKAQKQAEAEDCYVPAECDATEED